MLDGEVEGVNINQVWRDLLRLRREAAEFHSSVEKSWKFLETAHHIDVSLPGPMVEAPMLTAPGEELRERAAEVRALADRVEHHVTKQALLQIAASYDRLAHECRQDAAVTASRMARGSR